MPISSLLSFKLIFLSTSLLSAAVALKLTAPAIADFAVTEVPTIYNGVVSWLRPPYLYLVINCIIITIVASSKLQYHAPPPPPLVPVAVAPPNGIVFHAPPLAVQQVVPPREFFDDGRNGVVYAEAVGIPVVAPLPESVSFEYVGGFNDLNRFVEEVKSTPEPESYQYGENFNGLSRFEAVKSSPETVNYEYGHGFNSLDRFEDKKSSPESVSLEYGDSFNGFEDVKVSPDSVNLEYGDSFNGFEDVNISPEEDINAATEEEIPPEMEIAVSKDEFSVSKSEWSPAISPPVTSRRKESLPEIPVYSQKPPVASRFGHRRSVKASPEGGKAVLGVSRSKKQDTLETTWKTITEGRAMPLTRHLRKSDTWEREGHHGGRQEQRMTKSETLNDGGAAAGNPLQRAAGGSGKLKKEASLGQDDLNRRVEAFIKKFNEDMRLQRQESLNQYKEMISRGAH